MFYIVDKLPRSKSDGGEWDAILRTGVEPSPEERAPQVHPYYRPAPRMQDPKHEREQREKAEEAKINMRPKRRYSRRKSVTI
ncbi:uncharacterized protein Z518_06827 [Rhinocladiella mackenziei CBS 650.93]|uniref:Rhinocladiella mackenziei CBS 650.93 unplaced genomic scaffold supercont1.5, whole genome shotgun sequence n=1 Tax=Rhinocladiella mackenziei CBS 650.93 TaxID=1442369 RepID=A0A0D2J2T3_9EURO|nr:uncharacterized protein Z518_06827 [Rhinocladiella mackenziei CBS 650.93]KIX03275.1 hypothetical protein Z518_06827 [Rhinocladiella mackenziei CBS 650.93]